MLLNINEFAITGWRIKGGCFEYFVTVTCWLYIVPETKMNFYVINLLCLAMLSLCEGHIGGGHLYQDVTPQVYCGRILARTIAALCYQDTSYEKRSEGTMYGAMLSPYYKEEEENQGWWVSPHKARAMGFASRNKRFIVNECCDKPCKVTELLAYC